MVGRREKPIDPRAPYADLAYGLRGLKRASGKSLRQISRDAHFSPAVLCEAASGWFLPSLEVTLGFVEACGGDTAKWTAHWTAEERKGQIRRRKR